MNRSNRLFALLYCLLFILVGNGLAQTNITKDELITRIGTAMVTHDIAYIKETILLLDTLIKTNEYNIRNLYYTKAQLYFRLRDNDNAINTLLESDNSYDQFNLALLFLRLGRFKDSEPIFDKIISDSISFLDDPSKNSQMKIKVAQNIALILRLLNRDATSFFQELHNNHILSDADVGKIRNTVWNMYPDNETVIRDAWPD